MKKCRNIDINNKCRWWWSQIMYVFIYLRIYLCIYLFIYTCQWSSKVISTYTVYFSIFLWASCTIVCIWNHVWYEPYLFLSRCPYHFVVTRKAGVLWTSSNIVTSSWMFGYVLVKSAHPQPNLKNGSELNINFASQMFGFLHLYWCEQCLLLQPMVFYICTGVSSVFFFSPCSYQLLTTTCTWRAGLMGLFQNIFPKTCSLW